MDPVTATDELFPPVETRSTATISPCGRYRYDLTRRWGTGPVALWVMLNPSTADADQDDPTIRRCRGFSTAWGCGGLVVVNLFAYRATKPAALNAVRDPCGPDNWATIDRWLWSPDVDIAVAAWGASWEKVDQPRLHVEHMAARVGRHLVCLGRTKAGHPRHPLYVRGDTAPQPFGRAS